MPRTMTAGYVASTFKDSLPDQIQGNGTGLINLEIIDHTAIQDQNDYKIIFSENDGLNYSVLDEKEVSDTLIARLGNYHKLSHQNIDSLTFELHNSNGTILTIGSDYDLLDVDGQILIHNDGSIFESEQIIAKFLYYPIKNSKNPEKPENLGIPFWGPYRASMGPSWGPSLLSSSAEVRCSGCGGLFRQMRQSLPQ